MEPSPPADVVYVDSDRGAAETASRLERRTDLSVAHVASGADAREAVRDESPDCVAAAGALPDCDGLSLLSDLGDAGSPLGTVLFDRSGSGPSVDRALDARLDGYVALDGTAREDLLAERVERAAARARAERRREDELRVGRVVRRINRVLVRSMSRAELERGVCEVVSDSDPYVFAWVGHVDPETDRIVPRAWSGVEEGYLDEISVTADESPTGLGPGGRAARTGAMSVVQDVQRNPAFEPWREAAVERGYQSVASIPLRHGGTTYGVLSVYADRPDAFDDVERELLEAVADDAGYAVHALELRERVERYAALTENAPVGVFRTEAAQDGRIVEANPAAASLLGYDSPDGLVGRPVADVYGDPATREAMLERAQTGEVTTEEVRLRTAGGDVVWGYLALIPHESDGGTRYFDGAVVDVTRRKELERSLGEEREFVERVLETSPVGITVVDRSGRIVRANEYAEEVLQLSRSDITGRTYDDPEWNIFDEDGDSIPSEELPFASVLATGRPVYGYEHGIEHRDGTRVWLSVNAAPVTDEEGDVDRVVAVVSDVTERREYERRLREQRDRLETVVSNAPVVLFALDEDGVYTLSEGSALEAIGFEQNEAVGQSVFDLFEGNEQVVEAVERALAGERVDVELEVGDAVLKSIIRPVEDASREERAIGVAVDVTERKTYERELELFRTLIDDTHDAVFVADPESGEIGYVNDAMVEQLGYEPPELRSLTVADVEEAVVGETGWDEHVERLRERGSLEFVGEHRRKDGTTYPVEVNVELVTVGDESHYVAIARDVSELRERVQQLRAMSSVLRHNVRNDMNVVLGYAELLREQATGGDAYAEKIAETARELLSTTEQAYRIDEELVRRDQRRRRVDLGRVVRAEHRRWDRRFPDAVVRTDVDDGLWAEAAPAFPDALGELVANAVRHSDRECPAVTVTARRAGDRVLVSVEDDGPGVPAAERAVLRGDHEPDQVRHASGLGLWFVRWVVRRSGGSLDIEAADGGGTVVTLDLPAAGAGPPPEV